MNRQFWGKMSDEYLKNNPEPPPLTDDILVAFEKQNGLKLPKALLELLRIKNGGLVENSDFKFNGEEYHVDYFKSVGSDKAFDSIQSYARILEDSDMAKMREQLYKKAGDLSRLLLVAEPNGFPYAFTLNYNRLNSVGEPVVECVCLREFEEAEVRCIADSFEDFLAGQYFGDDHPTVDLAEAEKYKLIAKGSYEGRYEGLHEEGSLTLSGLPVRVTWKICSHRNRLIVFQMEDWAGKLTIRREEIPVSALTFDFPSLESYGVELEPDLAELIRPGIEIEVLSKFDAPLIPECYELLLHIQPGHKEWVSVNESSPCQGRWKNRKATVVYSSVKSTDRGELLRTLQAVVATCSGEGRFVG